MVYSEKNRRMHGMTIIEMVIAIGIFSMISIGIVMLFSALWRLQGFAFHMGTSSQQASHVIVRMTDLIRNARQSDNGSYVIMSAMEDEFIFFSNADSDSDAERVRLFRDESMIKMGIIDPSGIPAVYDVGTEIISIIAKDVVDNVSGEHLFVYYNKMNEVVFPITVSDVRMAEMNVTIDTDIYNPPAATLISSFSSLRNLRDW